MISSIFATMRFCSASGGKGIRKSPTDDKLRFARADSTELLVIIFKATGQFMNFTK